MSEIALNASNFDETVLKSDIPVVVDFWAPWCGPCKMFAPTLAKFAEATEGKVLVGKVNVDDEQDLAMKYGVANLCHTLRDAYRLQFATTMECKLSNGLQIGWQLDRFQVLCMFECIITNGGKPREILQFIKVLDIRVIIDGGFCWVL